MFCDRPAIELIDGKPAPAETTEGDNANNLDEDSEEAEAEKVQFSLNDGNQFIDVC